MAAPPEAMWATVVVFESGESESSLLEGFTLLGGQGSWFGMDHRWAGGILIVESAPRVVNCVIAGNRRSGVYAICFDASRRPALVCCSIVANVDGAMRGAGPVGPSLESCIVWDNPGGAFPEFPVEALEVSYWVLLPYSALMPPSLNH
jgi:hypothetical protein